METGTAFTTLDFDTGERFVALRRELGVTSLGLNLILLEPGQRGRVHRHERQEEVYLVLDGVLTLELEGGEARELGRWDAARVAPEVRRRLVNRGPERVAMLALGGTGEHRGRDGLAWESWESGGEGLPPQEVPMPPDLPRG